MENNPLVIRGDSFPAWLVMKNKPAIIRFRVPQKLACGTNLRHRTIFVSPRKGNKEFSPSVYSQICKVEEKRELFSSLRKLRKPGEREREREREKYFPPFI
jgi:hypothetical protein